MNNSSLFEYASSVIITSIIAAVTVGGKAFGKSLAIRYSKDIIFQVGKILHFLEDKFHIVIIKDKKKTKLKQRTNKKRK
jgi:uncharacterized Zn finger protein